MKLQEGTKLFNAAIAMDRMFNFCTGGSWQECFSTRAYKRSRMGKPIYNRKRWRKIAMAIDYVFWQGHCRDSFLWEMRIKQKYINDNKHLL
jgi:hypothetical protein